MASDNNDELKIEIKELKSNIEEIKQLLINKSKM